MGHAKALWRYEKDRSAHAAPHDGRRRVSDDRGEIGHASYRSANPFFRSVGRCIAYLAVNPPSEKVVTLGNAEILKLAAKYTESGGKA